MSEKMSCPVCLSHESSAVDMAFFAGEPCPYCKAPAQLMAEVASYRKGNLDKQLVDKFAEQGRELATVRKERDEARLKLREIMNVLGAE